MKIGKMKRGKRYMGNKKKHGSTATPLRTGLLATGKIFLLPLRPVSKPEPDTEYPSLPFLREHDLEAECIKLLSETEYYHSIIPAIKHVRDVMGWGLVDSKDYVDRIRKEFAGQIEAAQVAYLKSWRK
jgi:hypothetical protein